MLDLGDIFVILFIVLLLFSLVCICFQIVEGQHVRGLPIDYAEVVDIRFESNCVRLEVMCDTTYKGSVRTYTRKIPISMAESRLYEIGEVVEFDEKNNLIFKEKEK